MSGWFRSYGFEQVYPDLIVGAFPLDRDDVAVLHRLGIERVLNLVQDAEYDAGAREEIVRAYAEAGIVEQRMHLVDFGRLPAERIDAAVDRLLGWLAEGHRAYVHCRAGWQRSASVAAGVVAVSEGISIAEALVWINRRKPTADPLPHQREDLAAWWLERSAGTRG